MKFELESTATNKTKLVACLNLLRSSESLVTSNYTEGTSDSRNTIREDAFIAAAPILKRKSLEDWVAGWYHTDLIASDEILKTVRQSYNAMIDDSYGSEAKGLRETRDQALIALKTGSVDFLLLNSISGVVSSLFDYSSPEYKEVEAYLNAVKNSPKYKIADKTHFQQLNPKNVMEFKDDLTALTKAQEAEKLSKEIPYKDSPLTQKIKAVREKFKGQSLSMTEIKEVGEIVFNDFQSLQFEKTEDLEKENDDLYKTYANRKLSFDARMEAGRKFNENVDRINKRRKEISKVATEYIANIRPLWSGTTKELNALCNGKSAGGKTVHEAIRMLPAEISKIHLSKEGLSVKHANRACFDPSRDILKTHDTRATMHELGHRLSHNCLTIFNLEKEFYERRTKNEPLVSLRKVCKEGSFRSDEMTRVDHFLHPYMGKSYNDMSFELISMGFEYFYFRPEELKKDPDYAKFILGILATL